MNYQTNDDSSNLRNPIRGGDTQILEDFNEGPLSIEMKRACFAQRTENDVSMDLNDLLQDMEEERGENQRMDWSSLNLGSFKGSFCKRGNGSSRSLIRMLGSSSKKLETDAEGSASAANKKRRKSVRFFKFETILPSQESFRRRVRKESKHRDDFG